jgi:hypothetical protein
MATLFANCHLIYTSRKFPNPLNGVFMKSKLSRYLFGLVAALGIFSTAASADSLTLRDGRHVQGKFAGGTRGVIAFSVGGATQYYEVSNILLMSFETEGTDAQDTPGRQPSIIPDPGSLQRQKLHGKTGNANTKSINRKSQQKRPVRFILVAQRSQ